MELSDKCLKAEYGKRLAEFAAEFGIRFTSGGARVEVYRSDRLTAEYDGETLKIGDCGGSGLFRALFDASYKTEPYKFVSSRALKSFGIMLDCSRGAAPTVNTVKKLIRFMAAMGYDCLQLYCEDMFQIEDEPFFGYLRGRYSADELRLLDGYAADFGIELVPCVQTLAHFTASKRWAPFADGMFDIDDILLADEEKTYEFIEKIFAAARACFKTQNIHIGMDEAHLMGLGKYLDRHGYVNRFDILCRHLNRVAELAERYGFKPMMWSDMFFRLAFKEYAADGKSVPASVIAKVPENIKLVYWDYYSTDEKHYDDMFRAHGEFNAPTVFAGGFWKWTGFAPHNGFSIKATRAALNSAKRYNVSEAFFTMWGDNGAECPVFAVLPSMAAAAEMVYGGDCEERFLHLTGISFADFMALDLPDVLEGSDCELKNPSKYLLYNDCFMGIFDCTADSDDGARYAQYARKLFKLASNDKWGYMFSAAAELCRLLAVKADLGNRTHAAYLGGKGSALNKIAEKEYASLIKRAKDFYRAFKRQWLTENKPQGFEIHDARLGGLIKRIESCRETLMRYINGAQTNIPELEEPLIDVSGCKEFLHKHLNFNCWQLNVSGGVM